jgi:F0F1-type ATP synthase assembly protein I
MRISIMRRPFLTGDGSYGQIEGSAPPCTGLRSVPFPMSEVLARNTRLVARVVLLQAGCACFAACMFLALRGMSAGIAALAGGLIVAGGSAVFGWRAFRQGVAAAPALNTALYAGVALKWLWFALALYVALARLKLDAVPLLIGMVVAQVGYWVALVRLK